MMTNRLLIRADVSPMVGTGHVMRCIALAQAWQKTGGTVSFVLSPSPPEMFALLEREGMHARTVRSSPATVEDAQETANIARDLHATWIVLDGYSFGPAYHAAVVSCGHKLLLIDDGAGGSPCADIILNQNLGASAAQYAARTKAKLLLGPQYLLLREEFTSRYRDWKRDVPTKGARLFLSLGGSDPGNLTKEVLLQLAQFPESLSVEIVVGPLNPVREELQELASNLSKSWTIHVSPDDMPALMERCDLAIIAAGGTTWELLFMQTAVLSFSRTRVQADILQKLDTRGALIFCGPVESIATGEIVSRVAELVSSGDLRAKLAENGRRIVDGEGAKRVVSEVLGRQVNG